MTTVPTQDIDFSRASELAMSIRTEVERALIGQRDVIEQALVGLLAGGHVLIEGLPGLGKTLLVRCLARTFSGEARRIQFTPDLMPADIVGHVMYDMKSGDFRTHRGPVFTNLLLADEINRSPAKTQAAMLEAMQE
ncbi:MAG: AAA family ATPase, partial [Myxococcota bacterium]